MKLKWGITLIVIALIILVGTYVYDLNRSNDMPTQSEFPTQSGIQVEESTNSSLPIPELLIDSNPDENISDYYLSAQNGISNFFEGKQTATLGYNGNYLGPVIKVSNGEEVRMHVDNELDAPTSVHWHGLVVPGSADGGPHQLIPTQSTWEPSFTIDQPASTLWFHPHVIGSTATQVYYGLAGMIIVEDENSKSLNLPDDYGINDIPLIIQDRSFNQEGDFVYVDNMMDGAFGEYILVNGAITPNLEVDQVKMRFRVLNGANARNFNLRLEDNNEFHQIASDGGLLESPINMESLFVTPGERAEIIIDFSDYSKGDVVRLLNDNELVMTFIVGEEVEDTTEMPDTLAVIEKMDESLATNVKTIVLDGMGHMVSLNGKQFDMNRIDDNVALGDIEIWEISTRGAMMMGSAGHPFHIHGTQFQVLSRNGNQPYSNEQGWKDTVYVRANETVRIIVKFEKEGLFMYHCHILEHEEAGMMGQLEVSE
ncbi:MAG: multicopper oxidase domain-containing protein [Clostridia bacterium]|nr:multicopper oxidase domain-containing protein [Clostridia bacterium]